MDVPGTSSAGWVDGRKNNSEKSSRMKVSEHIPCGYSMSMIWTFNGIENKYDVYRGEDGMEKICDSLREHAMKMMNNAVFEKAMENLRKRRNIKLITIKGKRIYLVSEPIMQQKLFQVIY